MLTLLLACSGGENSGAVEEDDRPHPLGRHAIAFPQEASDVSHVFVTDEGRGFVNLRRDEPSLYFLLGDGRLGHFSGSPTQGQPSLKLGEITIALGEDASGAPELVLDAPSGTQVYGAEEMGLASTTSRAHALLDLDELDEEVEDVLRFFGEFRHSPPIAWLRDRLEDAEETLQGLKDDLKDGFEKLEKTLSEYEERAPWADPADADRELVSEAPISVPPAREPETILEIHEEAQERIRGDEPSTEHLADAVLERTAEGELEPTEWRSPDAGESGVYRCVVAYYEGGDGPLALVEHACVSDPAACEALGGGLGQAEPAADCATWCKQHNGIHFGSSELDGSNLLCYPLNCVATLGQDPDPKPIAGDEACDLGCEAEYCEDREEEEEEEENEAWIKAILDDAEFEFRARASAVIRDDTLISDLHFLQIYGGTDRLGFEGPRHDTILVKMKISSRRHTGRCEADDGYYTSGDCYVELKRVYEDQDTRRYESSTPGWIEISRNDGEWIDGSFYFEVYHLGSQGAPRVPLSGSFHIKHPDRFF